METAVLATLIGALFGALMTVVTNRLQRAYELKLSLREKVLEKRISAHEQVISAANSMIAMAPIRYETDDGQIRTLLNEENEIMRYPHPFQSKEKFLEFQSEWTRINLENSHWLSIALVRELYLFQDYLINLGQYLETISDRKLPIVGDLLRVDFIDFSSRIKRMAYQYFYSDLEKLKLEEGDEWHKYEWKETTRRLSQTEFFKKANVLMNMAGPS